MKRVMMLALIWVTACAGTATVSAPATPTAAPVPAQSSPGPGEAAPPSQSPPSSPDAPAGEPQPYVPAGRPGSAESYTELITRLAEEVPAELRADVPWPNLRSPNPIVAQIEIFELWIWMAENLPESRLVEVMAVPESPSRDEIAGIFRALQADGVFERRIAAPYVAFDHIVVTFESAGLPLWLAQDVPADAVVVYYSDNSGPITLVDQDTGAIVDERPGVGTRAWLSIMVPTDVGWQLFRDQLIEPSRGLETPNLPPPGFSPDEETSDV